jgi:site-specific DNA-cytosine methylase
MLFYMKSLEIFAGGGGLALGVTAAGFSHTSLVEWDTDSAKTLHHNYTVIGYWSDSMQRFTDYTEAVNPEEAAKAMLNKHNGVSICAVIEGWHQCVDNCEYVRREVAELRGSLQPHAAGCIVTTSHFSRAAVAESAETGKVPITLVDGYELARIAQSVKLDISL